MNVEQIAEQMMAEPGLDLHHAGLYIVGLADIIAADYTVVYCIHRDT